MHRSPTSLFASAQPIVVALSLLAVLPAFALKPRLGVNIGYDNFYPQGSSRNVSAAELVGKWTLPRTLGRAIVVGDVQGDSKLEVVWTDMSLPQSVSVYSHDGQHLWSTPTLVTVTCALLHDTDGDGKQEVFICHRGADSRVQVSVYSGTGVLLKTITTSSAGSDPGGYVWHASGDTIVVVYDAGYSSTGGGYRGIGFLSYANGAPYVEYRVGGAVWGTWSGGDLDRDGRLDVALAWGTPHNGAYWNGTDDYQLWSVVVRDDATTIIKKRLGDIVGGSRNCYFSQKLADLDGDGYDELLGFEGII